MDSLFLNILTVSLTTSVVIAVMIMLGNLINKRYVAKWKYWLWVVLALRLLVPFNYRLPDAQLQIQIPAEVGTMEVSDVLGWDYLAPEEPFVESPMPERPLAGSQIADKTSGQVDAPKEERVSFTLLQAVGYIWIAGTVFLLLWQVTGFFCYKRSILKKGKPVKNPILIAQLHELSREFGVRNNIIFMIYEKADSPMVIGFWKPVLVLPKEEYTLNESFYILRHELVHMRRHDVLVKFLLLLARDLHWFNPVVYLMHREAVVDMEIACDEAVVRGRSFEQREVYTETLLSTLHSRHHKGSLLTTQFSGGKRVMKKRFRNILTRADKKNGAILFAIILVITGIIGTMVGWIMEGPVAEVEAVGLREEGEEIPNQNEEGTEDISGEIQEGREASTVLTVMKEGMPEEIPATLYVGEGYSFYLTDGDWDNFVPNAWQAEKNNQIHFYIGNYEGLNKSQVERILTAQGYTVENGELWVQEYDMIYRTICYETENDVWTVNFTYPWGEAEEGWIPVMRAMADTFAVDAGYDVGAHTERAIMPEGEQLQLYEVTYTDQTRRNWYVHDPEFKGSYVYDEITISNITDTTFDFIVTRRDFETDETEIVIPFSTAYISEDMTSATYTGEDYTLTFDFTYKHNPLPVVLFIRVWGVDELEGILFYNNNIPGYEAE